jgi:guanine deaminase
VAVNNVLLRFYQYMMKEGMMILNKFMKIANEEAIQGITSNEGGPFGAVIIKDGVIVAQGHNEVLKTNDPTAHAEVVAIRKASALLGRFDLSDCEIYSSCEPCPMCLAAIFWSRIKVVNYGCTKRDAAAIGFDDDLIYEFIKDTASHTDSLQLVPMDREECLKNFSLWLEKDDKVSY